VRRIYDVAAGSLVLIRPDGYVGLIAPASAVSEVGAYLDRIGARPETPNQARSRSAALATSA
jgi:hypothetical protein